MSELWDEHQADAAVIGSLKREITNLRRRVMKILRDSQNNLYRVHDEDAHLLTEEQRTKLTTDLQEELSILQQGNTATPDSPASTPAPEAPQAPETPPAEPAPADNSQPETPTIQ